MPARFPHGTGQGVDLAEVIGQPPEERVTAQVMQEALAAQLLLSRPDCADGRQKHHNLCGYRNLGGVSTHSHVAPSAAVTGA